MDNLKVSRFFLIVIIGLLVVILGEVGYILFYPSKKPINNNQILLPTVTPVDSSNQINTSTPTLKPLTLIEKFINNQKSISTFESMLKNNILKSSILINDITTSIESIEIKKNPERLFITVKNGSEDLTYMYNKTDIEKITVFQQSTNGKTKITLDKIKPGDKVEMIMEFDNLSPESDIKSFQIIKL